MISNSLPVGVGAVDAVGDTVAGLAGVGAVGKQRPAGLGKLVDGVDLPGEVVETDGAPALRPIGGADTKEAEVVVVARSGHKHTAEQRVAATGETAAEFD